jgi:predicted LPLAT superfamily acyltransferase
MSESTFLLGIWLLYGIYRLFGRWPFRCCLYPVVLSYWLSRPLLRAASLQYLRRIEAATGVIGRAPGARESLRHFALFAETMLDKLLAASGRYRFDQVRSEGREQIHEAALAGQGGVIVTAHIGCLELCRTLAGQCGAIRLNILVHTRHAWKFNRLLQRMNPNGGFTLLEVSEIGPASAVLLNERVAAGEFVVIAGDRVPLSAGQTTQVDFLGYPAPFPVGPYVLAALLKCPLYLLGCIHEGDTYAVHFERLAECVELPRGRREVALARYAARYADRLAVLLKRSPYDWFNFFPFWDQVNMNGQAQAQY